jgi:hypothetical protein
MNREQIIQMAREAGIRFRRDVFHSGYCDGVHGDELEAFAKLVAEHEREACAILVDHILKEGGGTYGDAIRARGQA